MYIRSVSLILSLSMIFLLTISTCAYSRPVNLNRFEKYYIIETIYGTESDKKIFGEQKSTELEFDKDYDSLVLELKKEIIKACVK